jgi:ketosteroid isomerase-like protein
VQAKSCSEEQSAKTGTAEWHRRVAELLQKGDAAAVAKMYTKDAELYYPGQPVIRGREAIERDTKEYAEKVRSSGMTTEMTYVPVEQNGDSAYNICVDKDREGKVVEEGIAVGFWKREGGEWKLHRDFWSPTAATKTP